MSPTPDRLKTICESIELVVRSFAEAGYELFLVGGVVRDALLANSCEYDIDLTTNARPDQIRAVIEPIAQSIWDQGERFGTLGARVAGKDLEITTYRAEVYSPDSRKPEVSFGDTIQDDLERRDFTINAIAFNCIEDELLDPFGGQQDLTNKTLRTPADPVQSFSDDPLRVLRAGRFAARLDLKFDQDLVAAARGQSDRMSVVSAERINVEIDKLLAANHLDVGFEFLAEANFFEGHLAWLRVKELRDTFVIQASQTNDVSVRRVILFSSAPDAATSMQELKYSKADTNFVTSTLSAIAELDSSGDSRVTLRKLIHRKPEVVTAGVECVSIAGNHEVVTTYKELIELEGERLVLPITGDEVMARLGIASGPAVGEALDKVSNAMYERGPITADEAWELLAD